jgi:hypothetical protein
VLGETLSVELEHRWGDRWERNRSGTGEEAGGAALGDLSDSAESWGGAALGDTFGFKLGQSWFGRRLGVSAEALRCIDSEHRWELGAEQERSWGGCRRHSVQAR